MANNAEWWVISTFTFRKLGFCSNVRQSSLFLIPFGVARNKLAKLNPKQTLISAVFLSFSWRYLCFQFCCPIRTAVWAGMTIATTNARIMEVSTLHSLSFHQQTPVAFKRDSLQIHFLLVTLPNFFTFLQINWLKWWNKAFPQCFVSYFDPVVLKKTKSLKFHSPGMLAIHARTDEVWLWFLLRVFLLCKWCWKHLFFLFVCRFSYK